MMIPDIRAVNPIPKRLTAHRIVKCQHLSSDELQLRIYVRYTRQGRKHIMADWLVPHVSKKWDYHRVTEVEWGKLRKGTGGF